MSLLTGLLLLILFNITVFAILMLGGNIVLALSWLIGKIYAIVRS